MRFVRRTACAPFGHFEKARHSTLRRAGKEPSACPQPHRAAVPAGPASYTAVGPAPAGTPCAHSERRGARRTFPAGKAKRPPFGREPRGQHCLQRACHFTQDMPQTGRASRRGLRAGPAPPAGTPCAHSERCGAGRRSENDARRGTYFAGPVRLRALRAALSFARFLRWGYRLPRRAVLWYNMST